MEPDIKAFERFFKITQEFKIEISLELKIAILFIISSLQSPNLTDDNSNYLKISLTLDKFYKEICATNSEKKYLQFLYSNFTKISKENPLRNLKILLAFNNKTWVKDLYLLVAIKNPKIKITKEILDFIDNFFLPIFPLNGNYFKELGFREKEIGIILNEAKIFWAENDFNSDILFNDFLKNQIKQKSFL